MTTHVRPAVATDACVLATFAARTFTDAFGAENQPEDVARYLDATYSTEHQERELTDPTWFTLLVEHDATLAGFAQLRAGHSPACVTGPAPLELARFYVGTVWHGRGIAQRLMEATLAAASEGGAETLWLGVWERNPRAIAFYGKCGFIDVGEKTFAVGSDLQHDRVLVRHLPATP